MIYDDNFRHDFYLLWEQKMLLGTLDAWDMEDIRRSLTSLQVHHEVRKSRPEAKVGAVEIIASSALAALEAA